jgi:hypothetical protein
MPPEHSPASFVPLSARAASDRPTAVASVSGLDSRAPDESSRLPPERSREGQGVADPKPQPQDGAAFPVGRRSAPRLRISLSAQLIAVDKAHPCILLNLSRTGAQVAILDAMREGEGAILRCGMIDHFAIVTRSEFGLNALMFDEPLTDGIVLETRRYYETFEEREKRALIETARKWATGDTDGDRAT